MAKCNVCKKPILYNKFKKYRGKILCKECYDTRLERKRQKKLEAEKATIDEKELEQKAAEYGLAPSVFVDEDAKDE